MIVELQQWAEANRTAAFATIIFGGPVFLLSYLVIYNLYLSPLRDFPGPKYAAATPIPYLRALLTGNLSYYCFDLHEKYGEVVRIAPSELSFACAEAWRDVHGPRPGHVLPPKQKDFYTHPPNGVHSIITANHEEHGRLRRLLSHGFSEKALRDQEPLMKVYVDLLIQRLHERSKTGEHVDMVAWFNWTTFDLIGDLMFGEPFDCLKDSMYHPWVDILFTSIKAAAFFGAVQMLPGGRTLLGLFTPAKATETRKTHQAMTEEKVNKRLARETDRPDFMRYILKHKDSTDLSMTREEIMSTSNAIIVAGSETTATLMSGATYYLLMNPDKLKKLVDEVRGTFQSEDEINLVSVNQLKYMLASLEESLRVYPPVPIGLPRTVPPNGDYIVGKFVPGGTTVSVNHLSTYHSPRNFRDADKFIPERFLGDPAYENDNRRALQPFSVGARNCVGRNLAYAEMRLIMARVLWNFDLSLKKESKDWPKQHMYTLWDKGPLWVKLTPVKR